MTRISPGTDLEGVGVQTVKLASEVLVKDAKLPNNSGVIEGC